MKFLQAALMVLGLSLSLLSSSAVAGLDEGLAAIERQDYRRAFRELKPLAIQGDVKAQYLLGAMYFNGEGVPQNKEEAAKLYRLVADKGVAIAMVQLGGMYFQGQGLPQSYEEAMRWYRRAADLGHAKSQFNVGAMYDSGQGVPQNNEEAMKWYRRAADQGDSDAKIALAKYEELEKERIAEAKRLEADKLKAEEAARIEAEAKRKAEEAKRIEAEAKRKAERNVRIASWITAVIGLLGVIALYLRRRKKVSANQTFGHQRKATQAGTAGITANTESEDGGQQAPDTHGLKRLWASALQDKFLTVVYPVLLVVMAILIRANDFEISQHSTREPLPSCGGGFIAQCIQRNGLDPRLEGDARFQSLYNLCSSQCQ